MTIRSNPPGAVVYVDNYEIGATPVSTSFTYYGTRQIRLVKDGYETVTTNHRFAPPWYQIFPLDFVTENLVPGEIRDERSLNFQMTPQKLVSTQQLYDRAEYLRHAYGSVEPTSATSLIPAPAATPQRTWDLPSPPPAMPPPAAPGPQASWPH